MNDLNFPSHKDTLEFINKLNYEKWEEYNGVNLKEYIKLASN